MFKKEVEIFLNMKTLH